MHRQLLDILAFVYIVSVVYLNTSLQTAGLSDNVRAVPLQMTVRSRRQSAGPIIHQIH